MSQYISSFLIDPVVRQARRFSRSNPETPHPTNLRPSLSSNEESPFPHIESPAAAATAAQEEPPHLSISARLNHSSTITGHPEEDSPTSVDDRNQHAWPRDEQPNSTATRSAVTDNLEPSGNATRYTLTTADDISNRPLHRVPDRLTSTTSSFSSSSRSLIDAHMSPADGTDQSVRTNTPDTRGRGDSAGSGGGNGSLPEDDGMGHMRKRIIAIQRTDSSNEKKARLVHGLMTEKHNLSQQSLHGSHFPRAHSPGSCHSSDRPWTPSSPKSIESLKSSPPTSSSSNGDGSNPFQLSPDDLKPTYYQKPLLPVKDGEQEGSSMEIEEVTNALGCEHYKRNIKLQCSACNRWYTCRFCHDAVEDHMLNRRETKNMLCMLCGCAQPASEECALCSERGAWYYCDVCKLWDDDAEKSIYHCNDCGICRVGKGLGKDFFHCKTCCVCMSISIQDTHRCIERSTDCDCPICGEYMFTSPQTVVFMRCGHSIHHRCYGEHMKSSYKCPICSRSIVNMEWQFRHLDRAIETQPMPPEFQDTKAWVYCNDCSAKTSVKYHWLGLKCVICDSYNTAQLQLLCGPDRGGEPAQVQEAPQSIPDPSNVSRPNSRGRSRHPTTISHRPTTSAPPTGSLHSLLESTAWPDVRGRNAHSVAPDTAPFAQPSPAASSSDTEDSLDTDDDCESEMEFWGGGSPRSRLTSPNLDHEMAIDGDSEEEDGDDSADESMSDDAEEDEADKYNRMDIFGHR